MQADSRTLVPGELVRVAAGAAAPADCALLSGAATVDESGLTGEAMPVRRKLAWRQAPGPRACPALC